jgi:two-component system NtrC family sensor kinase
MEADASRKEIEKEIEEMHLRVLALEKLATLGELVRGIAHEIKNPISFISNFAELSLSLTTEMTETISESPLEDEQRVKANDTLDLLAHNLEQIVEQGKRVTSIIQHMLAQAKGEEGELALTEINQLIDECAMLTYHGVRAGDSNFNVKFVKDFDTSLGSFYTVEASLARVFLNLFNNAYFTVRQKKERLKESYGPVIGIVTKKIGDMCEVRIRDNGEGISQASRAKIFTPFFTTKDAKKGTGLGLSLSHNVIVKEHHGTLTFESEEGQFTEFVLTFPIRREL